LNGKYISSCNGILNVDWADEIETFESLDNLNRFDWLNTDKLRISPKTNNYTNKNELNSSKID